MAASLLEETLLAQMLWYGLPEPKQQYRFHPKGACWCGLARRWAFDFCFLDRLLAVEIEGGTWVNGRHIRGKGFALDCEKYAHAASMGYRVIRLTTDMVRNRRGIQFVWEAYNWKPKN